MKITVICHGKPRGFRWAARVTCRELQSWAQDAQLDESCVITPIGAGNRTVYLSPARIARQTAERLFEPGTTGGIRETSLLAEETEVPLTTSPIRLPLWLWRVLARLPWPARAKKRAARDEAEQEVNALIDEIARADEDCILLTHPRRMQDLLDALHRRGYEIKRGGTLLPVTWLERALAAKDLRYCGCCPHNCLLSHPGCGIGQNKAALSREST